MRPAILTSAGLVAACLCLLLAIPAQGAAVRPASAPRPALRGGDGGTRTTKLGSLRMTTPRSLVSGRIRLRVSAVFEHVGWLVVTLLDGRERVARGVLIATEPQTARLALKLPRALPPGAYRLTARYRPLGEKARSKGLRIIVQPDT